jgi:apolipoprotein N-acyltransferase
MKWLRENLARAGAALLSGILLSYVSPPVGYDWLHWFSFVPVFLAITHGGEAASTPEGARAERRSAFRLGYLCGASGVFTLFFWLAETIDLFSNIPLAAAAIVVLLFALVWGLPYGLLMMAIPLLRRRFGHGWMLLFPALWVAEEMLWPSLFPYYQGVGQYRNGWTWQLASLFGAYGLSYLIIASNAAMKAGRQSG